MVLMLKPSDASHACNEKLVRLNGRPDAKLKNRMAAMRLSPNAWSRVGLVASVKPRNSTWIGTASAWRAILPAPAPACGPARRLRDCCHDNIHRHVALPKRLHRIVHETRSPEVRQFQAQIRPRQPLFLQRRIVQYGSGHRSGGTRLC